MTDLHYSSEVLIIDDETQIRHSLRVTLEAASFAVREANCGNAGLKEAALRSPDLIILDLGLPDLSGLEVLKRLREWTRVPILILSVRAHEDDIVSALDAGADDYLAKPFSNKVLIAHLRVMLRHAHHEPEMKLLRFGDIQIDFISRVVTRGPKEVSLTEKEYSLLRLLISHQGKVLTHRQILSEIWGQNYTENKHYLRVYIDRLRHKLEDHPSNPQYLKTVLGIGYRFTDR
ncbi:MAG TPA: response regulator [Opitutaceae bacterium]